MTRWPGWARAWALAAGLAAIWLLAMVLTPEQCSMLGRCPWTSGFGIFLIGAPVVALSLFVGLAMTVRAWWRGR